MNKFRKYILYSGLGLASVVLLTVTIIFWILHQAIPEFDGTVKLNGLSAEVRVHTDEHGVPSINAANRTDAVKALGYVTARDRLFQMDLMRRNTGGRLAEIFGEKALDNDIKARTFGFNREVKAIREKLPPAHLHYLQSYADGVNSYLAEANPLPFEFTVLGYRPEPWTPEDSLLVILGICEILTSSEEYSERMLSVMEETLPEPVMRFLTPDTDPYTELLLKQAESHYPVQPIPVDELAKVLAKKPSNAKSLIQISEAIPGSNAWAISGQKTADHRAILANDMHLGISVPNIWYRSQLNYGDARTVGVTLPGTPMLIVGSNQHIAWGATNLTGDFLDLVKLDINPNNPDQYRVGNRWQPFEQYPETITIRGQAAKQIVVKQTVWGPVSTQQLLGQPVALHWTILDANAINMTMFDIALDETLDQAIKTINNSGGPQLNVLLTDDKGHIAWTLMGKIPKRFGNNGLVSRSWADGKMGWNGYVDPADLPRIIDPPEGILVSANDRRLGANYPYVIGHQFGNGYRAYRITERLNQIQHFDELAMFDLQLDTKSDFFAFYQQLALDTLTDDVVANQPDLIEMRKYLLAWDGRADVSSLGFPLLAEFRKQLIGSVFTPFISASLQVDKNFNYSWSYIDTPLQALLSEKPAKLLPDAARYQNWNNFILRQLKYSKIQLQAQYPGVPLMELYWGQQNKVKHRHPFSRALPLLGTLLDMPSEPLPGCAFCVRTGSPDFAATERLVVAPGHFEDAILHMPGGQSGQPMSPYYHDQQEYWLKGLPMPMISGKSEHTLLLEP